MAKNNAKRRATRRAIHAAFGGRCFYCGAHLAWEGTPRHNGRDWIEVGVSSAMDIEHKVPIIRGGKHALENVVAACKACNSTKRLRTIDEFRLLLGLRSGRMPHVFYGESSPKPRDYLVVASASAIAALVQHNARRGRGRSRWDAHALRKNPLQ